MFQSLEPKQQKYLLLFELDFERCLLPSIHIYLKIVIAFFFHETWTEVVQKPDKNMH